MNRKLENIKCYVEIDMAELKRKEFIDEIASNPKLLENLSTDRLDMSYGEIISMYQNDDLIINPEFQKKTSPRPKQTG